jgi:hypothetical protein
MPLPEAGAPEESRLPAKEGEIVLKISRAVVIQSLTEPAGTKFLMICFIDFSPFIFFCYFLSESQITRNP